MTFGGVITVWDLSFEFIALTIDLLTVVVRAIHRRLPGFVFCIRMPWLRSNYRKQAGHASFSRHVAALTFFEIAASLSGLYLPLELSRDNLPSGRGRRVFKYTFTGVKLSRAAGP
jgi:hypothetical protein